MRTLPLLAVIILATGCGSQPPVAKPDAAAPITVATAPAMLIDHGATEVLPGTVKAAQAATLMARVPGVVARIHVAPGTKVQAGALLMELDAQEIAAKREQALAGLASAEAAVAEAKAAVAEAASARTLADIEWGRAKQLIEKNAATRAELDAAESRAKAAAARVEAVEAMVTAATRRVAAAKAGVDEATVMVGYTRLVAPFAGVVVRKHAEVGDLLAPGRPVIELEDPASMRLEVAIPESLAARVAVGTRLKAQVTAAALELEAAVVEVIPAADPVSRTVLAKLALPTDATGLRSGQFGRVSIATAPGRILAVPASAVMRRGQLDAVFVAKDGVARMRLVRLGGTDGDHIIIRAGLAEGEAVVTTPPAGLADGQIVK